MEKKKAILWLRENWLLVLIILAGVVVRVYEFGDVPRGLNQDEVSGGYDAWSIYEYGVDRNGYSYPVVFQGFGAGQNSLHQYLSMPFIAVFGLNKYSTRAVDLVFGIIALIVFYLFIKEIWNKKTAILATFLLATCPWHILLSRWGMDENLFPAFFLIGAYLLVRSLKKEYNLPVSFLFLALSLYGHNAAYFIVPLFVLLSSVYLLAHKKVRLNVLLLSIAVFCIVALPAFLYVAINFFDLNAIETPFFSIPKATIPRFKISTLFGGQPVEGVFHNFKALTTLLAAQADESLLNQFPPYGFIYQLSVPFAALGLFVVLAKNRKIRVFEKSFFVLLWFLLALALGLLVYALGNRISIIFLPLVAFTAVGMLFVKEKISPYLFYLALVLYILLFASFSHAYFTEYSSPEFFESFDKTITYATNSTKGPICITGKVNMPYAYVLFYEKISPLVFSSSVEYFDPAAEWRFVKRFDRYYFGGEGCKLAKGIQAYVFHDSEAKIFTTDKFSIKRFKDYGVALPSNQGSPIIARRS